MKFAKHAFAILLTFCLLSGLCTVEAVSWPTNVSNIDTVLHGIDVSSWQGAIDWDLVKSNDIDFVFIRSGYGTSNANGDNCWLTNAAACAQRSIPFGVYYYSYACTTEEAQVEANNCISQLNAAKALGCVPTLPVFYDLEDSGIASLDPKTIADISDVFCNTLKVAGYNVGIYANPSWLYNHLTDPRFGSWAQRQLWLAHWNPTPDPNFIGNAF